MLRTTLCPTSFGEAPAGPRRSTVSPRSWISVLATAFAALREALAASRQYEQMRSHGVPHDPAIKTAFGMDCAARHAAIRFAGRG